jgi:hypothetical protein
MILDFKVLPSVNKSLFSSAAFVIFSFNTGQGPPASSFTSTNVDWNCYGFCANFEKENLQEKATSFLSFGNLIFNLRY